MMNNYLLKVSNTNFENRYIVKRRIKTLQISLSILAIIYLLLIFFLIIYLNLNNNYKKSLNIIMEKKIFELKKKYINDIDFYKTMLQLYIENRTQFYIKGRERVMASIGKSYNDSNILTIQDKYNWLIIHDSPENKSKYVDKILLHEYSKEILGKDICVPILKIYNNIDEINVNELPNKFVLKCNHGSTMNILCNNKSNFDIIKAKRLLKKWMNINYGLNTFEYQYINVKKKVFAEKYLVDNILDYKFYCFNGEPKFIRVQKHLHDKSIHNYYNLDFTLNEIETNMKQFIRMPEIKFPKPHHLDLMIEYAKKLSSKFIFVRVDLYEVEDIVYLGELTFTSINVHMPYKDLNQSVYLGSLLDLKKINNSLKLNKNIL